MSGSFWATPESENALKMSDELRGVDRRKKLTEVEEFAAEGASYLPVWLVKPRAWAQKHLTKPEFDGSGQLLLEKLRKVK